MDHKPCLLTGIVFLWLIAVGCAPVQSLPEQRRVEISADAVNINTVDKAALENIPHIGPKLADTIIEYRQKYGPFRRTEHLLLIDGISDTRFREIRHLIRVD